MNNVNMRLPTYMHTDEAGGPERVYAHLLTSILPLGNRSKIVTNGILILSNDPDPFHLRYC